MKALIQGTRIAQVSNEEFPVASPLFWADVPSDTTTQDSYVDGAVVKYVLPPVPPPSESDFAAAIELCIDKTAKAKAYSGAVSLASYVNSTIPTWKAEADAFVAWRDAVWVYAYTQLGLVQAGQREAPTIEVLLSELPPISWPE